MSRDMVSFGTSGHRVIAARQTEPPSVVAPLVKLALFIPLTVVAAKRFHSGPIARV